MIKLYNTDGTPIQKSNIVITKVVDEPDYVAGTDNITEKFEFASEQDIDKIRSRNWHIEKIIDYMVENKILIPNLYEVSDEHFENLRRMASGE